MSLLQDNDYSSDDDDPFTVKDSSARSSGKGKKGDKKGRSGEDKKSTRTKNKENVVKEKTPKKGKAQATKSSTSWSPPDSPKQVSLPSEVKTSVLRTPVNPAGVGTGVGGGQLQPSPNVKNQRKRYSQLASGSEDEEGETSGVLSNKPVLQDQMVDGVFSDANNTSQQQQQQQSNNPFLTDNATAFFANNNSGLATTTTTISSNVTSSLGANIAWPSFEQQQQQQQPWVPMMPSGAGGGGMGSVNPLLFAADFDHSAQQLQQQAPINFDPNPVQAGSNMGFEPAPVPPSQAAAAAMVSPQHGPWGMAEEDPFKTTKIAQLLQPLVPQQPTPESTAKEADTNPFRRPIWHAPQPPEVKSTVGVSTTEVPVQNSDVTPPPAAVAPPFSGGSEDWSVSEDLRGKCMQQFHTLQPVNGVLEGDNARQFFGQSKLPYQELSAIWRLSDRDQDNALSQDEFCIAMKLVLMRRKGVTIPATLPEPLASLNLAGSSWTQSSAAAASSVPRESVSPTFDDLRGVSPPLVDLQEPRSAGQDSLLVVLDDSSIGVLDGSISQEQTASHPPTIGRIISLDSDSGEHQLGKNEEEEEEEDDEDSVLVKLDDRPDKPASKPSKPAKPAPPKPRIPKFNRPPPPAIAKKKTSPTAAVTKVSSSGELSPSSQTSPPHPSSSPPSLTSSSNSDVAPHVAPHVIDSRTTSHPPPPKPPRPQTVPSKKSSYMALLSSPVDQGQSDQSESPVPEGVGGTRDHAPRPATGGDSEPEGTFHWKMLSDTGMPSSSADESSDKGHSRSTSLDLNKMLMGTAKSGDVFGGLPSAVPPKPPPKLKRVSSPPPESLMNVPEGGVAPLMGQPRPRSLSTGSMASTGPGPVMDDGGVAMDTSADALLLHSLIDTSSDALLLRSTPPPRPKPRKAPLLPPKPTSFPSSSTSSGNNTSSSSLTSGTAATTAATSRNLTSSLGSKHTTKPTNRSMEGVGTGALRRTGPQNRANLAELYQQGDAEVEDSITTSLNTRLVGVESGSGKGKSSNVSAGTGGLKDKTGLKASIRSLKENNEALQDINRTLEQKLFQLMDERVRLARELDLLNALS